MDKKKYLLDLKEIISNEHFKHNMCLVLSTIIFLTSIGFTTDKNQNKNSLKSINPKTTIEFEDSLIGMGLSSVLNQTFNTMVPFEPNVKCEQAKLNNEGKKKIILEKYKLTEEQFNIVASIVLSEAKANSYEDAYAVINTMYNRIRSKTWISYTNSVLGENKGKSLYYQAICPNQFVVYQDGIYQKFLNSDMTKQNGYQAIIDLLFEEETKHNYLRFLSAEYPSPERKQFVENGNCYFQTLTKSDTIKEEEMITYNEENEEKSKVKVLK